MELLAGSRTRVLKRLDQLRGSFIPNSVEVMGVLDIFVPFQGGSNNKESRTFEENNLGGAACLCEG